jgi:hypothetical protein
MGLVDINPPATYDSKFQPCIVIINSTGLCARMYHSGINTDHQG